MKQFKIKKNGKHLHIFARDEADAVKKLKESSVCDSLEKYHGYYIEKIGESVNVMPIDEWDRAYPPKERTLKARKQIKATNFNNMSVQEVKKKIDSILSSVNDSAIEDSDVNYNGYKIKLHSGYNTYVNMKDYYEVYAPEGYLVGGAKTINSAKDLADKDKEKRNKYNVKFSKKDSSINDSNSYKDELMDYLFSKKYRITQQHAKSKKTGDDIIVYTATNNKQGKGIQFGYNTKTHEIEIVVYRDLKGVEKQLHGLGEIKSLLDSSIKDKLIESGSEEALQKNIATEIEAGKDPKQAAAIAYSVQRKNDADSRYEREVSNALEKLDITDYELGDSKIDNKVVNYMVTYQGVDRRLAEQFLSKYKKDFVPVKDSSINDSKMTPERMIQLITPIVKKFAQKNGVEDYYSIRKNGKNVTVGMELGYQEMDKLCDILNEKLKGITESYFEPADAGLIETTIFDSQSCKDSKINDSTIFNKDAHSPEELKRIIQSWNDPDSGIRVRVWLSKNTYSDIYYFHDTRGFYNVPISVTNSIAEYSFSQAKKTALRYADGIFGVKTSRDSKVKDSTFYYSYVDKDKNNYSGQVQGRNEEEARKKIESKENFVKMIHFIAVRDSHIKDGLTLQQIKRIVAPYNNTILAHDNKNGYYISSSSADEIAEIARKLGIADQYTYEADGYFINLRRFGIKDSGTVRAAITDMPKGAYARYFAVSENASEKYNNKAALMKDLATFGDEDEVKVYSLKNVKNVSELMPEDLMFIYKAGKIIKKGPMINDKSVFSEETMNSVKEGIDKDYDSMENRISEMSDAHNKNKPKLSPKGKWVWDEVKGDWFDTGAKMYYEELRDLNLDHLNDSDIRGSSITDSRRYYTIGGYKGKYDPKALEDIKKAARYNVEARLEKLSSGNYQLVLHGETNNLIDCIENYFGLDASGLKDSSIKDYKSEDLTKVVKKVFTDVGKDTIQAYADYTKKQGNYKVLETRVIWGILNNKVGSHEISRWYDDYGVNDDHITSAGRKVLREMGINLKDSAIRDSFASVSSIKDSRHVTAKEVKKGDFGIFQDAPTAWYYEVSKIEPSDNNKYHVVANEMTRERKKLKFIPAEFYVDKDSRVLLVDSSIRDITYEEEIKKKHLKGDYLDSLRKMIIKEEPNTRAELRKVYNKWARQEHGGLGYDEEFREMCKEFDID